MKYCGMQSLVETQSLGLSKTVLSQVCVSRSVQPMTILHGKGFICTHICVKTLFAHVFFIIPHDLDDSEASVMLTVLG